MFSDEITTTDVFLDMPKGSQLLYFHLGMNADDDGFIASPKMIMRSIGSSDDELKVLFAKKFLLAFDNGVCVVKHWRINNQIRKDRYTETKYTREKSHLFIRENGAYTFTQDGAIPVPKGHFLPSGINSGNQVATVGRRSIGKVSIGKVSKEKIVAIAPPPVDLPAFVDPTVWQAWCDFRKGIKKTLTPASIKMQLNFLSQNEKDYKAIIEQSIMNGWTGLFPLKGKFKDPATRPQNVITSEHSKTLADKMAEKAEKNK